MEISEFIKDFAKPCTLINTFDSSKMRGKYWVLYFYPKDNTPGCTNETREFNERLSEFQSNGCEVVGINHNSMKSHEKFAEKLGLGFPLVSDEEQDVLENFGVWQLKKMAGREYMGIVRSTFIISPEGKILKKYDKVKVKGHGFGAIRFNDYCELKLRF